MARIAGVNVPENKHLEIALTHIYGIGKKTAQDICLKRKTRLFTKKFLTFLRNRLKLLGQLLLTTQLRVIFVVQSVQILKDLWILDVTEELGIEENCQFMVKGLKPMQGLERVQKNQ